jgi:hypothetical protein
MGMNNIWVLHQPSFAQLSSLLLFFVAVTSLYIISCMKNSLSHTLTFFDMWGVSFYLHESMEIICKCGILVIIILIN